MISCVCTTFPAVRISMQNFLLLKLLNTNYGLKCLAEFLTEIEFYQKTENGVLAETKEDP